MTDILKKYKIRFSLTLLLILTEAALAILFPLFIGFAIDGIINGSHYGVIQLGVLSLAALIVGVGRRVLDSRLYAQVYQCLSLHTISRMKSNLFSKKSARLDMIRELVEFSENLLPELVNTTLGLVGVICIIGTLNLTVFYCSLIVTAIIFLIYWITSARTIYLNKAANDESEKQVDVIASNNQQILRAHLRTTMKWNVKLSDLEAVNFSISWLVLVIFLLTAIIVSVSDGILRYGAIFSLIMYVFQYIENVINLPMFYQHFLRLKEIKGRLEEV
ncbi:MAG: ABC transporter six-transmembrane domain-containing protein [Bacteroidota bacterium]